jgi:2-amino-4-hydroxy-6-hydroxymethyldihydropteridine diphosphokinase
MNQVYLLTGGNLGNRAQNLARAKQYIAEECGTIVRSSALYETAAWGKTDQPAFLNQVLFLQTPMTPAHLIHKLLNIEQRMGRLREEKNGPRTIDIDILFFNDAIIHEPHLVIPHPRMQDRRFVLVPLNEIASEWVHPVFKKTVQQLLTECQDHLPVRRYD